MSLWFMVDSLWNKKKILVFLLAARYLLLSTSVFAQEKEPVIVDGDVVEYFEEEKKVEGTGNVVITYKDMKMTCDKITVYTQTKDAYAEGNVKLYQNSSVFSAERVTYNFETQKGTLTEGSISGMGPWYGKAEEVEKVAEGEFHLKQGYITTCDLPQPHYRIQARNMEIFLEDKVVAKDVVLFIGNYPLSYLPSYTFPFDEKRPRVTIIPGHNKEWGSYALSAWRYYLNAGARGHIHLDYRELKGLAEGFDFYYKTKEFGEGKLRTYYMQERDRRIAEGLKAEDERWRVQLRHRWKIDAETNMMAEYHEMSDGNFIKDYYYREEYERENQPQSYVSVIKTKPESAMSLLLQKRVNNFFSATEYLPELKVTMRNQRIKDSSFYYAGESSFADLTKKRADSDVDDDAVRFDTYNKLSHTTKLAGWLALTPWAGTRQSWYSKNIYGDEDKLRGIFTTGLDVNSRFYRIFNIDSDFLGMEIHKLRHVVTPTIRYSYTHDPTISSGNLQSFDTIDDLSGDNTAALSLENKLQTKRMEDGELKTVDLATLIISGDYNFHLEDGSKFTEVKGDLELQPYRWLRIEADTTYNTRTLDFDTANVDLFADKGAKWQFGLGSRYQRNSSHQLTTEFSYEINPKWKIRAYERFDCKRISDGTKKINDLVEQEYAITRDLHCWIGEFIYNTGEGDTIWLVFRLKAFPEIPFKFNASYRRPKPGSRISP